MKDSQSVDLVQDQVKAQAISDDKELKDKPLGNKKDPADAGDGKNQQQGSPEGGSKKKATVLGGLCCVAGAIATGALAGLGIVTMAIPIILGALALLFAVKAVYDYCKGGNKNRVHNDSGMDGDGRDSDEQTSAKAALKDLLNDILKEKGLRVEPDDLSAGQSKSDISALEKLRNTISSDSQQKSPTQDYSGGQGQEKFENKGLDAIYDAITSAGFKIVENSSQSSEPDQSQLGSETKATQNKVISKEEFVQKMSSENSSQSSSMDRARQEAISSIAGSMRRGSVSGGQEASSGARAGQQSAQFDAQGGINRGPSGASR